LNKVISPFERFFHSPVQMDGRITTLVQGRRAGLRQHLIGSQLGCRPGGCERELREAQHEPTVRGPDDGPHEAFPPRKTIESGQHIIAVRGFPGGPQERPLLPFWPPWYPVRPDSKAISSTSLPPPAPAERLAATRTLV